MTTGYLRRGTGCRFLIAIAGLLLLAVLSSVTVQAAPVALPPRPTEPPSVRSHQERAVAQIELNFELAPAWQQKWQELASVVQWQDSQDNWHDVDGWRGSFDGVVANAATKTWAVSPSYFGAGPFRWKVYEVSNARETGYSQAFSLPHDSYQVEQVTLSIAP
jgi:hypothetical protein